MTDYELQELERSKRIEEFALNLDNIDLEKEELSALMFDINLDLNGKALDDNYMKFITYIDICKEIKHRIIKHRIDIVSLYDIFKSKKKDYKNLLSNDKDKINKVEKKYNNKLYSGKTLKETIEISIYNTHNDIAGKTNDIKFLYEVFNHCKKVVINSYNDIIKNLSPEEMTIVMEKLKELKSI